MASGVDQLREIYVVVGDKAHPEIAQWHRSPHAAAAFTDAEVITIGLLTLGAADRWWLYVMDSQPISVCEPLRHGRVRLLREERAYFGKSSKGWFLGFKLHAIMRVDGRLITALLTPANGPDREVALALGLAVPGGIVLGDLEYRGAQIPSLLADVAELWLIIPADAGRDRRALISTLRERIETRFRHLWHRFVDRVFSRSWQGLWNTLKLKMLHYTLGHAGLLSP